MLNRLMPIAVACIVAVAYAAVPADAEEITVNIKNFAFDPPQLTIKTGTTVIWVNGDDAPHNVVESSDKEQFKSKPLDTDGRFSFTFTTPDDYKYFCSLHPQMTGGVTVLPQTGSQ